MTKGLIVHANIVCFLTELYPIDPLEISFLVDITIEFMLYSVVECHESKNANE